MRHLPAKPFVPPRGFKQGASPEKILVGAKRTIEKSFDAGKWKELAYILGQASVVEEHPRLLRSLGWGDEDYSGHVFSVLRQLAGEDFEHLESIADFIKLPEWLESNDPKLYSELCETNYAELQDADGEMAAHVSLAQCEDMGNIHSIPELGRHAARILSGLEDGSDPELAIGSAKELLESVLKTVTGDHAQKTADDIQTLLRKAQKDLDIDPKNVDASLPGAESLRRTLSNLGQIVVGVAELRTLYGTGHGRSQTYELKLAHARLIVNAAISIATFLLEVWQEKRS
jgi:hypothetical protein